ncbi:MAG: threonine transporter RhtB [Planctomycetota bacterium]|nr:MAG: threonine transporter RhtB [Planctomycetota bacterium]
MLPIDTVITFILASVVLALVPGPDNIFVLMQTILHGRKEGFCITVGLCTGLLVHTGLVVLGISYVFKASFFAFTLLKLIGAGYLLYLAWLAFNQHKHELDSSDKKVSNLFSFYQRGIIMNMTNPKVGLFFMAYLPQFVVTEKENIALQLVLLGTLFILSTLVIFSIVVLLSNLMKVYLIQSESQQKIMNRVSTIIFIALAINLIFVHQE